MSSATLVGDRLYISKEVKIELFENCNIKLEINARSEGSGAMASPVQKI